MSGRQWDLGVAVVALSMFAISAAFAAPPADMPAAIYTDPPIDAAHPASGAGIQFQSHGATINAMIYRPAGAGPHPTVLLSHGLPGNEQNLDLAQALRRAGWMVIAYHYRGSWGSGGDFTLAHGPDDAKAILDIIEDPVRAAALGVDPKHIVLMGHSYGGYVSARTGADRPEVKATVLISPFDANIGKRVWAPLSETDRRAASAKSFGESDGRLGAYDHVSIEREIMTDGERLNLADTAPGLANRPLLVLTASHDNKRARGGALFAALHAARAQQLTAVELDTDHSYNDHRIALEAQVLNWVAKLPGAPGPTKPGPTPRDAIYADPPADAAHPATGAGIQFTSHGAQINAQLYRPAGAGPHPTVLLNHGLPGYEQNLDLAQAMRRAGWTVITYHYRGSWGSGGTYSLAHGAEDGAAILEQLQDPAKAAALGVDRRHIVVMGHSYGGFVSTRVADAPAVEAVVLIAPWDISHDQREWAKLDAVTGAKTIADALDDVEGRVGATSARMVGDEILRGGAQMGLSAKAATLAAKPLLILVAEHDDADDQAGELIAAVVAITPHTMTVVNMVTDHGFNDHRIALESEVLQWLSKLPGAPPLR